MGVDGEGISGREEVDSDVDGEVEGGDGVCNNNDDDDDSLEEEERRGGESSDSKASIRARSSASAASSRDRRGAAVDACAGTTSGARNRSCRVEPGSRRS